MASDAEQDIGNGHIDQHEQHVEDEEEIERPRALPADLPTSLDDRRNFKSYNEEAEYYDAWQGEAAKLLESVLVVLTVFRPVANIQRTHHRKTAQFQLGAP